MAIVVGAFITFIFGQVFDWRPGDGRHARRPGASTPEIQNSGSAFRRRRFGMDHDGGAYHGLQRVPMQDREYCEP
jgi:hypothetical protein